MRILLSPVLSPTPLLAAVQVLAVSYFALWGCFNTAAPTLRPVAPFAEDRSTQIGVGVTGSTGLLNTGFGSTVYASHRFGPHFEAAGYGEIGTVVPGVVGFALLGGSAGPANIFGGVLGFGGALRLRTDLFDILSVGIEGQAGAAGVVLPAAVGAGSGLALGKSYIGVPVAVRALDWLSFYTNPGVGLIVFAALPGATTVAPVTFPLPQIRLPLGVMFTPTPRYHVMIESGIEGIPLISSGPYLTIAGAADF